jgi:hypothetical protein
MPFDSAEFRSDLKIFFTAVNTGDIASALEFLKKHGDEAIDHRDKEDSMRLTALMQASLNADIRMIEFLLHHGANPRLTNAWGENAALQARKYPQSMKAAEVLDEWAMLPKEEREQRRKTNLGKAIAGFSPALTRSIPAPKTLKVPKRVR